jgi:hypothetical protein
MIVFTTAVSSRRGVGALCYVAISRHSCSARTGFATVGSGLLVADSLNNRVRFVERDLRLPAAEAPDSRMCSLHRALSFERPLLHRQIYARRVNERLECEKRLVDAA